MAPPAVPAGALRFGGSALEPVAACPADVLLELTPLSPLDGEPARAHLEAALRRGMHAVTANKGPIAHALPQWRRRRSGEAPQLRTLAEAFHRLLVQALHHQQWSYDHGSW